MELNIFWVFENGGGGGVLYMIETAVRENHLATQYILNQ